MSDDQVIYLSHNMETGFSIVDPLYARYRVPTEVWATYRAIVVTAGDMEDEILDRYPVEAVDPQMELLRSTLSPDEFEAVLAVRRVKREEENVDLLPIPDAEFITIPEDIADEPAIPDHTDGTSHRSVRYVLYGTALQRGTSLADANRLADDNRIHGICKCGADIGPRQCPHQRQVMIVKTVRCSWCGQDILRNTGPIPPPAGPVPEGYVAPAPSQSGIHTHDA